jgi:hypothetical protein
VSKGILQELHSSTLTQKEIKAHVLRMTDRPQYAKTVPDTWSHHTFVPINSLELKINLLSSDTEDMYTKVGLTDVDFWRTNGKIRDSELISSKILHKRAANN